VKQKKREDEWRAGTGGHWVCCVLKKPLRQWREMGGEDDQCGVAGKEVSKPAEIG